MNKEFDLVLSAWISNSDSNKIKCKHVELWKSETWLTNPVATHKPGELQKTVESSLPVEETVATKTCLHIWKP